MSPSSLHYPNLEITSPPLISQASAFTSYNKRTHGVGIPSCLHGNVVGGRVKILEVVPTAEIPFTFQGLSDATPQAERGFSKDALDV